MSNPIADRPNSQDLSFVLQHVGYGLIGLFLAFLLKFIWPLALLEPAWQLQFVIAMRTTGLLPLLAAVLLLLVARLDGRPRVLAGQLIWVRRAGFLAAIGYVLLIPLQFSAEQRLLAAGPSSEPGSLRQATQLAEERRFAADAAPPGLALPHLAGAAPEIPGPLRRPLDQGRSGVPLQSQRRSMDPFGLITDGLADLALAACFAAFGSLWSGSPPLLLLLLALPALLLEASQGIGQQRRERVAAEARWIEEIRGEADGEAGAEAAAAGGVAAESPQRGSEG